MPFLQHGGGCPWTLQLMLPYENQSFYGPFSTDFLSARSNLPALIKSYRARNVSLRQAIVQHKDA